MGRVVVDWLSVIGTTEVVYSLHHAIEQDPGGEVCARG